MAGVVRIELTPEESEASVLPLHHTPAKRIYFTIRLRKNQAFNGIYLKKATANKKPSQFFLGVICYQYIPSIPPAPGIAGVGGSGISATNASVVSKVPATLAAFWSALLVTLVGSRIPACIISQYASLDAS